MAKKKTAKKATNSNANKATNSTQSANKTAYDFADMSKNFNPSQMWNLSQLQSFQPANMQQMFEQIIETSQRNLETMTACTQMAVERAKEMMEEQAEFTNAMLQDAAATWQEAMSNPSSDPRAKMEEINEYAKHCMEQAAALARATAEQNMQIAQEIGSKLSERLNESVDEIRTAA